MTMPPLKPEWPGLLGCGSASAFNTAFAREVGQPPGQYAMSTARLVPEEALV